MLDHHAAHSVHGLSDLGQQDMHEIYMNGLACISMCSYVLPRPQTPLSLGGLESQTNGGANLHL